MYYRRLRKPSKPAVFAMLMGASLVMVMLPRDFFAPARSMTQLAALPQYAVNRAAQGVARSAAGLRNEPVSASEHAQTLKVKQALENENTTLRHQLLTLQETTRGLANLHRFAIPQGAQLTPAQVVGWDAVPGRDSLILMKKRSPQVRQGDWVASNLAVQGGSESGIAEDQRVLARETLIGWVEQTTPFMSRVVLLSDPTTKRKWRVHVAMVGRQQNKEAAFAADEMGQTLGFVLEGIGKGQMQLLDVNARYINDGTIRVGDVVTTDGRDTKLPFAMVIGEIVELQQIKKQPLLYNVIVRHRYEPKDLSEVFIINTGR